MLKLMMNSAALPKRSSNVRSGLQSYDDSTPTQGISGIYSLGYLETGQSARFVVRGRGSVRPFSLSSSSRSRRSCWIAIRLQRPI
jgi:hypothetical protein